MRHLKLLFDPPPTQLSYLFELSAGAQQCAAISTTLSLRSFWLLNQPLLFQWLSLWVHAPHTLLQTQSYLACRFLSLRQTLPVASSALPSVFTSLFVRAPSFTLPLDVSVAPVTYWELPTHRSQIEVQIHSSSSQTLCWRILVSRHSPCQSLSAYHD